MRDHQAGPRRGLCVIADRFFDSDGLSRRGAELDREMVERLNAFVVGDCVRTYFHTDVDAATAASRMQKPRKADRMNNSPLSFMNVFAKHIVNWSSANQIELC
jgi:thymidylate kinase